ncbi:hypothetical protein [Chitinimonas koreensis]|uniref:hypothetical protein n=1 Tax=Chitinimonas koreensis TaxID=356302 RepID=UPI001654111C|nr:hypothetical protein [Chitinimonas koreensis]QNM94875.1 hypothetical protein H9L41_13180 [Chitinimonas koreensis]
MNVRKKRDIEAAREILASSKKDGGGAVAANLPFVDGLNYWNVPLVDGYAGGYAAGKAMGVVFIDYIGQYPENSLVLFQIVDSMIRQSAALDLKLHLNTPMTLLPDDILSLRGRWQDSLG